MIVWTGAKAPRLANIPASSLLSLQFRNDPRIDQRTLQVLADFGPR